MPFHFQMDAFSTGPLVRNKQVSDGVPVSVLNYDLQVAFDFSLALLLLFKTYVVEFPKANTPF